MRADIELRFLKPGLPPPIRTLPYTATLDGLERKTAEPTAAVYLRDATVITPGCHVLTSRNELIWESTSRWDVARELQAQIAEREQELATAPHADSPNADWSVLLGMQRSSNYNHWWLESLPRAWVADRWPSSRGCPLLMEAPRHSFQTESLTLLGWEDRVELLDRPLERHPRLLFVTGLLLHSTMAVSPWVSDFAAFCRQRLGLNGTGNSTRGRARRGRRLYVTRASASKRRVVNERELLDALSALDVEPVESERLGFEEQLRLFSQAELILGPHGAGLTNIIFAPPGARVIELLSAAPRHIPEYGAISALLGLPYGFLVCGRVDSGGQWLPNSEDMVADPAAVVRAARAALAER